MASAKPLSFRGLAREGRRRGFVRRARDHHPRRARAQPQEHRPHDPARQAGGVHRPLGLRKILARLRHHLRGRAAPLCRVALGLRPAVPGDDAEAGRRSDRRPLARHRHRAEDHLEEPALDRRHGDRDPRLHAASLGARRHSLFARDWAADRKPDGEPDGRPGVGAARAHAALPHRAGRARPKRGIPEGNRRLDEARFSAAQGRRRIFRDRRRAGARQEAQARHRGGGRPHRRARRHGGASRRKLRDRARPRRRAGGGRVRGQGRERERAPAHPLLLQIRLPGVRLHHRRDRAKTLLVQQSARRLPRVRRARLEAEGRSVAGRARPEAHLEARRRRAVGEVELALLPADAGGARETLPLPP